MASRVMLQKKRGRLVFISSIAAVNPNPGQGFYAASKLASEALYRNIGLELGSRGITTVSLRPGYIYAGRGKEYLNIDKNKTNEKVQNSKILSPNEAAEKILFYLSDSAKKGSYTENILDSSLRDCAII